MRPSGEQTSLWLLLSMIQAPVNIKEHFTDYIHRVPRENSYLKSTRFHFPKFDDNEQDWNGFETKQDGLGYQQIFNCHRMRSESPQLLLDVMDQHSRQSTKMMLCAMSANSGFWIQRSLWIPVYVASTIGLETFIYLGKVKMPLLQVVHWI